MNTIKRCVFAVIVSLGIALPLISWAAFQTNVLTVTDKVKTDTIQSQTGTDTVTIVQVKSAVDLKHTQNSDTGFEPVIATGEDTEIWYGNKTWGAPPATGSASFGELTDVDSYVGHSAEYVKVKAGADGLEYGTPAGAGTVIGNGTAGKMAKWTGPSAIGDASNDDTQVVDAVTKKHAHTGTANYIPKWNGTAYMDGTLFDSGGKIGIGTASPTTYFDVYGTGAAGTAQMWVGIPSATGIGSTGAPRITIGRADAAGSGVMEFVSNTTITNANVGLLVFGNYNIAAVDKRIGILECKTETDTNSGRLQFYTSNAGTLGVRAVIDKAGNVGIGGTTMTDKFEVTAGNIAIVTAGYGLKIKEGSNATMGNTDLVSGTKTISTTKVTANSRIFLTTQSTGGVTPGSHWINARTAGTSFVIKSSVATDTSNVAWVLIEPN